MKNNRTLLVLLLGLTVLLFAALSFAQEKAPGTVLLKGNPMGAVKFDHMAHMKAAGGKCATCHHASKPAKPLATPHERCQNCHKTPAVAPVTTKTEFAFHDAMAKSGICINCHKENAGKPGVPGVGKCMDCHKKSNG